MQTTTTTAGRTQLDWRRSARGHLTTTLADGRVVTVFPKPSGFHAGMHFWCLAEIDDNTGRNLLRYSKHPYATEEEARKAVEEELRNGEN